MNFSNICILEKIYTYFSKPYFFPKTHFPNYILYRFVQNCNGIQLFAEHFKKHF